MQVSVEQTSELGRKLIITVPATQFTDKFAARLSQLAKTAKVDGFRQGKAPTRVLKMRYGEALREEVLGDLLKDSLHDALQQEALKPAGMPDLEITNKQEGQDIEYVVNLEVYPEIKLADLSAVAVDKEVASFTEEHVTQRIEGFRKQFATWEEANRKSQTGDRLTIDFVGSIDGVEFAGGRATGFELVLGSKTMIPGFEDGLLTMAANEEKVIKVTFPVNYGAKDLAGKEADFAITVHKVEQALLPALDEEFAKKMGIAAGGVEQLYTQVRDVMQKELDNVLRNRLKESVLNKLVEVNQITLPKALLEQEIKQLQMRAIEDIKRRLEQYAEMTEMPDLSPEHFATQAKRRVTLGLLLNQVMDDHAIKLDEQRLHAKVEEITSLYEEEEQIRNMLYNDQNRLDELKTLVMEEQLTDKLLALMQVQEKSVDYETLLQGETN